MKIFCTACDKVSDHVESEAERRAEGAVYPQWYRCTECGSKNLIE